MKFLILEQMDLDKKEFESTLRKFLPYSKYPHFYNVYLVRVQFLTGIAVNVLTYDIHTLNKGLYLQMVCNSLRHHNCTQDCLFHHCKIRLQLMDEGIQLHKYL